MSTHTRPAGNDRIVYYREMAAAAAGGAHRAATPEIRMTYLDLAKAWSALADAAEKFSEDDVGPIMS